MMTPSLDHWYPSVNSLAEQVREKFPPTNTWVSFGVRMNAGRRAPRGVDKEEDDREF